VVIGARLSWKMELMCKKIVLKKGAHVGHGAVIHGANLGQNCLIGMNSVIMDGAQIGDECIVGAMSFVKAEAVFEKRQLIVGNPAKAIKVVSDEMIAWKTAGTKLYQQLPEDCKTSLKEVAPLREIPKNRPKQEDFYKTLQELRKIDK
jgi:phenylacetic acid degradation protein